MNIVALISGRGSNLEAIIKGINEKKIKGKISLVISNKKNARGLQIASNYGIKSKFLDPSLHTTRESYDLELIETIKKENPDLIVLAGYMRVLTDSFIDAFKNRIINIHPSLIPAFQGLKAQKQALEFGVKFTGCTVHFVTKELDSGPIIIQAVVPITPEDNEETISEKILHYEHRIYPQAIKWISDNRVIQKKRQVIVKNAKYGCIPVNPELEDF
ncbi:phosphoribosylglycinamide formyltransferase [Persephonella sp.]